MSYANGTTHYNLPQTVGTDKRDWADTNQAFADVDAALHQAAQDASSAASDVGAVDTRVTTLEGSMSTAEGEIDALQASDTVQDTTLLQHGQAINGLDTRVTALETEEYVEVTTDGVRSWSQTYDAAFALVNVSKLTRATYLVQTDNSTYTVFYHLESISQGNLRFGYNQVLNNSGAVRGLELKASGSSVAYFNLTTAGVISFVDDSAAVPAAGTSVRIYY